MFSFLISAPLFADDDEARLKVGVFGESVFKPAWEAVIKDVGLDVEYISSRSAKRRKLFVEDKLDMDCCSIVEWRTRPLEMEKQIYTIPFFVSTQIIIQHKDAQIKYDKPSDLRQYRVAILNDHTQIHQEYFGSTISAANFEGLFKLIADGQADISMINEQEFLFQKAKYDWPVVRGKVYHQLLMRARLHKRNKHLLPMINRSIAKLKKNGTIDVLIGKAMRASMH